MTRYIDGNGLTDEETTEIADEVYMTLFYNEELTDEQRVEIIGGVYAILQEYKYIPKADENESIALVEELYTALDAKEYLSDAQAMYIVDLVYALYMDDNQLSDDDINNLALTVITEILYGRGMYGNAAKQVDCLGTVGAILQKYGYVPTAETNSAYGLAQNLYIALSDKGYLTPDQTMYIVTEVLVMVMDCGGDLEKINVNAVIYLVYNTLFNWDGGFALYAFDLGDLGEINNESLSDLQKLDIILTVYQTVADDEDIKKDYPEVGALGGLVETLVVPDGEGNAVIAPEKVVEIMQVAMENIVNPEL